MKKGIGTLRVQTNPVIHAVGIGDRTRPACLRPASRRRVVNTILIHPAFNPIINRPNSDNILNSRFYPCLSVSIRGLIFSPTAWMLHLASMSARFIQHLDLLRLIPAKSGLKNKISVRISAFRPPRSTSHSHRTKSRAVVPGRAQKNYFHSLTPLKTEPRPRRRRRAGAPRCSRQRLGLRQPSGAFPR
jgi:hypothetical protein